VRNFYTGLAIFATHRQELETIQNIRLNAAMEVNKVLIEDWAQFVVAGDLTDLSRPESNLDNDPYTIQSTSLSYRSWKTKTLLSITEYIGLPRIESGQESPLFRLWNDFRCNCNPNSAILLAAYLAMTGKAIPGQRCAKEIVFLLGRIPVASIHNEYAPLQNSFTVEIRAVANQLYLQACTLDREGWGIKAERAYRAVIKADRGHPSAFYSLAYLLKLSGNLAEAVDMARTALENQPGNHTRTLLVECLALLAFERAQFGDLNTLPSLAAELSRLGATEQAEAISGFCNEALVNKTD
jgi:tetratricopeptide (TPR) repeat protein